MPDDFNFLVAVDVGNSAAKFWLIGARGKPVLPRAGKVARVAVNQLSDANWLGALVETLGIEPPGDHAIHWWISSVNKSATALMTDVIGAHRPRDRCSILTHRDVSIAIQVDHPERVGTDRLLAALAVKRLKRPGRSAIVVDAGSAITCDFVSADGAFQGGAILPGFELQLKSLSRDTAQLPLVDDWRDAGPVPPIGKSTDAAIRSGVTYGILGAVREIIHRIRASAQVEPELYFTGGDMDRLRAIAISDSQYIPSLVALGILFTTHRLSPDATV